MNENKTIAEIYEEVTKSPELQKEFLEAQKNGTIEEFAAKYGCKATPEEVEAFLKGKIGENKELSLDDLDQVAGGKPDNRPAEEKTYSCTCEKCGATFELKTTAEFLITIHNNLVQSDCDGRVSLTKI